MNPTQADAGTAGIAVHQSAADNRDVEARRREALRGRHRLVLVGAALVLSGSLLLEVVGDGRVAVRGLEAYPLPHTCAARYILDRGCPACGLTRSFIHLANGRWEQSLAVHRLGWLLAVLLLLQVPYRTVGLVQVPYRTVGLVRRDPLPLGNQIPVVVGFAVGILFVANWFFDLLV